MVAIAPVGATVPGVTHHRAEINGAQLHYVSAGTGGSPILLVHGWPETWWAFHKLIPLLATQHRVIALDLRGFGDSSTTEGDYDVASSAEDVHQLVQHLGLGPVHVLVQDISGGLGFRFAVTHPEDVLSFTAVESTLAGFGLEALADVTHGGSWHVGFLGAPGIPTMLLAGHERELIADWAYPLMSAVKDAITAAKDGSFSNEPYVGTLENEGTGLSPFNEFDGKVPAELKTELDTLKADIIGGKIKIESKSQPSE